MKRLLLFRHAKAVPGGAGIEDHERELMPRGREDAARMGRYIARNGFTPEIILASTSARTTETVELASEHFSETARVDYLEALYLAEPELILSIMRLASALGDSQTAMRSCVPQSCSIPCRAM